MSIEVHEGKGKQTFLPVKTLRFSLSLSFALSLSLCFLCFLSWSLSLCFDLDLPLREGERERCLGDFPRNLRLLLPPRDSDSADDVEFDAGEGDRRQCSGV